MKVEIRIEGNPRISQSTHYTRGGKEYQPAVIAENERLLKAALVNRLPYNFTPLKGNVRILKLHFVFQPPYSFNSREREKIESGEIIEKNLKPALKECFNSLIKAMCGTIIGCEAQISGVDDLRKYYSGNPCIILSIEEF